MHWFLLVTGSGLGSSQKPQAVLHRFLGFWVSGFLGFWVSSLLWEVSLSSVSSEESLFFLLGWGLFLVLIWFFDLVFCSSVF